MKILLCILAVIISFIGCSSMKAMLPPEMAQMIKDTNTDQHLGIQIGGSEYDLLKADERANQLIRGFINSLLSEQDMCMKKTAQYLHKSLRLGTCVKRDLAQYSLYTTKIKIRSSYSSANDYEIDSIYKIESKEITEEGEFFSYYLNMEKTRKVQVFFPKDGEPIISDFHFVR